MFCILKNHSDNEKSGTNYYRNIKILLNADKISIQALTFPAPENPPFDIKQSLLLAPVP